MGNDTSQVGQAPPPKSLEDNVLDMARGDPGSVYRAAQRQAVYGWVPILPHGILQNTQHLMHDMRDHQQKHLENAAQEDERVVYEAAALAARRTAAQIVSRSGTWRLMLKRTSVSHREDYCPKLLPSQLRHLEAQRHSNAEGVQLRNQCEGTRSANASIAPGVVRVQAREAQLSQRLEDAKARDGSTNTVAASPTGSGSESMDLNNLGSEQQLQTSKFELSRAQTEVSHSRSYAGRNQSTETGDGEDFQKLRGENLSLVAIFGNRPRLTDESST